MYRIVFMGTPASAAATLEALLRGSDHVVGVVTQPDRPVGRGQKTLPSPVRILARDRGIPVLTPQKMKDPGLLEQLRDWAPDVIAVVLRDLKIRGVTVPANFPVAVADRLRENRIKVSVVHGMFFTERFFKNDGEVKAIRTTMKAAESGLQAAIAMIRKSSIRNGWVYYRNKRLTAEQLREVVNGTIFDRGCVPAHTIVAPGRHGCDPHNPGSGPIPAHSPLIFDIFPRSEKTGYYADITRTVVKGKAPEEVVRMYRAVKAGQALALRKLRHGVRASAIHRALYICYFPCPKRMFLFIFSNNLVF